MLLDHPRPIRVACDTGEPDLPRPKLDEEQDVERRKAHGLHGEEVRRDDAGGLRPKKRSPRDRRPSRSGPKPAAQQHRADGGRRHRHAQLLELALDALVAQRGFSLASRRITATRCSASGGRPVGCGNSFMQLAGTRAGDRRADRIGVPGLREPVGCGNAFMQLAGAGAGDHRVGRVDRPDGVELAGDGQNGGRVRRFQPQRPVGRCRLWCLTSTRSTCCR